MWASNPPNPLSPLALPQTFSSDILHIKLYFLSSPLSVRLLNSFPSILIQQDVRIFSLRKFLTFLCFLSHRNIAPSASPKAMADLLMVILSLRHDFVFTVSYVLLTVHPCIIFFKWSQLGAHYFLVYLFQLLYMFQPTMCPSSEELTVSMRHWYFSLCMGGCLVCTTSRYIYFNFSTCFGQLCAHHSVWVAVWSADQTATRTQWKMPVSHRYSKFFWWWAHSCCWSTKKRRKNWFPMV